MNRFTYNEYAYGEYILNNGFYTRFHLYELKILGKYLKYIGSKQAKVQEILTDFCIRELGKAYNEVKYYKTIESATKYAFNPKNKLIVIESIPVTVNEINYIDGLDVSDNYKKVLLSFLVKNKLNKEVCKINFDMKSEFNFFGGSNKSYKEIHSMARIPTKNNIHSIIHDLYKLGIVDVKTRGRIELVFVNNIEPCEEVAFEIRDFENVGLYYEELKNEKKITKCEVCARMVRKTSRNTKYCKECKDIILQEQKNKWKREKWNKKS